MFTMEQINERINYLISISPGGASSVFKDLRDALNSYMTRSSEFELQVNKTLDKIIAVDFHYSWIFENMEFMPDWLKWRVKLGEWAEETNAPTGYFDLRELFNAGGMFDDLMTVSDREFLAAFYVTSESGSGNSNQVYRNRYVDKWVSGMKAALTNEMDALKAIMQYCANRLYGVEYAIIFERELGDVKKEHPIEYYARKIFYERGYGWLVDFFNLNVYRPTYQEELPDWVENEEENEID